ncbi:conserved hypothetical protein [Methanocaldococcus sp. FS406-22]|nr:conserved hypothetical protein [Methanocaldococcus sp. FS406-22]
MYSIKPSKKVLKAIEFLPKSNKKKLREFLNILKYNPFPDTFDIKKLKGRHPPQFRVRFGDFRLRYAIDFESKTIYLIDLERREKVYKK